MGVMGSHQFNQDWDREPSSDWLWWLVGAVCAVSILLPFILLFIL